MVKLQAHARHNLLIMIFASLDLVIVIHSHLLSNFRMFYQPPSYTQKIYIFLINICELITLFAIALAFH